MDSNIDAPSFLKKSRLFGNLVCGTLKIRNALKKGFMNAFEPAFSRIDCRKSQLLFRESATSNSQLFRILWTLFVDGLKFVKFQKFV